MFNPTSTSIESIFNGSVQYFVPDYQRPYEWGKAEALEFIEDLQDCASSQGAKRLFLGTLIFDNSQQPNIKIVDGQQRITTIMILLITCRELFKKLNKTAIAQTTQDKITFIDSTTAESKGARLLASDSIKDVFEAMASSEWDGQFKNKIGTKLVSRQINRIRPIYNFFYDCLKKKTASELSDFLRVVYNAYVVKIELSDELEAFSIFERTNARGIDLAASDLLKNYLFARGVADIKEQWKQIGDSAGGNILRMLKYFYVAHHGYISKSDLYKKLKEYGKKMGADELLKQLIAFAEYYEIAHSGTVADLKSYFESIECGQISSYSDRYKKIYSAFEGLRFFRVTQHYPLLYAAIGCYKRTGASDNQKSTKILIDLVCSIEKYHFINNMICERIGNEVEGIYAEFCVEYASSTTFDDTTRNLLHKLKDKLASEHEFVSRFIEIAYEPDTIPLIAYIFDRINNDGLDAGQHLTIFNPDKKLLRRDHNIEHFYPRRPSPEDSDIKMTQEIVDNIGNLMVIYWRTNNKLQNLSPNEKIKRLKGPMMKDIQNISYVRSFIDQYGEDAAQWGKEAVLSRAKDIAVAAYKKVWLIK